MRFAITFAIISATSLLVTAVFLLVPDSARQVSSEQQTGIGIVYDLMELSMYDLVHKSQLIVMGNVLDQQSAGMVGESQVGLPDNLTKVPGIRSTIQVEKVVKGSYEGKTINVITEGDLSGKIVIEGPAKFEKGERTIVFLYREKIYDGQYAVTGMEQGKYQVDSNGLIKGKSVLNSTSVANFDAKIKDILTKPKPETQPDLNVAKYGRDLTTEEIKAAEANATNDKKTNNQ